MKVPSAPFLDGAGASNAYGWTKRFSLMRSIFDEGIVGLLLMGTSGIERRIARFPQLRSSKGFVPEFCSIAQNGSDLARKQMSSRRSEYLEVIASPTRMTGGHFRLTGPLQAQIEALRANEHVVSTALVETCECSLVIGTRQSKLRRIKAVTTGLLFE